MASEEEIKRLEQQRQLDTSMAFVGDHLPPLWKRLYDNLMTEGFKDHEALDILKTYIISQGSGDKKAP